MVQRFESVLHDLWLRMSPISRDDMVYLAERVDPSQYRAALGTNGLPIQWADSFAKPPVGKDS